MYTKILLRISFFNVGKWGRNITYTLKGSTSTTFSLENILKPPNPFLFVFETRLCYSGRLQIHYGDQASLKNICLIFSNAKIKSILYHITSKSTIHKVTLIPYSNSSNAKIAI